MERLFVPDWARVGWPICMVAQSSALKKFSIDMAAPVVRIPGASIRYVGLAGPK